MSGKDTRLPRASVEGLPVGERLWRLMDPAWGHDAVEGTHGQQVLALTTFFIRDIGNGGLDQALYNFAPSSVELVLRSFEELGAAGHAALVKRGLDALFGSHPPGTLEARRRILDTKPRAWVDEHLGPLSEQLQGEEKLESCFLRYVDSHPSEFFSD
ncbi:DUF4375 domain-containing protein [Corallococcus exiguus]|uniref:DMP19 family protein n=1 Tax=Corallococcus exiguus TaxID=83462 RepID=UPI001A8EDA2D|nr:DUF4375 domain-containing protein [Corallococcus exiguus]